MSLLLYQSSNPKLFGARHLEFPRPGTHPAAWTSSRSLDLNPHLDLVTQSGPHPAAKPLPFEGPPRLWPWPRGLGFGQFWFIFGAYSMGCVGRTGLQVGGQRGGSIFCCICGWHRRGASLIGGHGPGLGLQSAFTRVTIVDHCAVLNQKTAWQPKTIVLKWQPYLN